MHIPVIGPNTSAELPAAIRHAMRNFAARRTQLTTGHQASGAASIEFHFDERISAVGVLAGEREHTDAYIIICSGNPGLPRSRSYLRPAGAIVPSKLDTPRQSQW